MNNASGTNANDSGATPAAKPPPDRRPEAEVLAQEAALARAAIDRTLRELSQQALRAGDPRAWAARYPWWSIGLAAAAGFFAGSRLRAASPSPSSGNAESAESAAAAAGGVPDAPQVQAAASPLQADGGWFSQLAATLGSALTEAVLAWARGIIQDAFAPAPPPERPEEDARGSGTVP